MVPVSAFGPRLARPSGLRSRCRECETLDQRERRKTPGSLRRERQTGKKYDERMRRINTAAPQHEGVLCPACKATVRAVLGL